MSVVSSKESKEDLSVLGNLEESLESRTIASRVKIRDKVSEDIQAFLSRGGSISEIPPDVTADPPKKPESNYGTRAI